MNTVKFEGKEITLTQEAYLTGPHEAPRFEASGTDQDGNDVKVTWAIKEEYLDMIDSEHLEESDLCDWDNPVEVYVY